jgi:hypothetical protein
LKDGSGNERLRFHCIQTCECVFKLEVVLSASVTMFHF